MRAVVAGEVREQRNEGAAPRVVVCLGLSQLIAWGAMHYLISVFGSAIVDEMHWQQGFVHGGFSCALLTMGACSAWVGRLIDRHGGRLVMMAGCLLGSVGCVVLAHAHHGAVYYAAWITMGLGMRLSLYEAAFASLARLGGASAKRSMSQITLFGGLASTVFWPLGSWLLATLGWREALLAYALALVAASLLHLAIPMHRIAAASATAAPVARKAVHISPPGHRPLAKTVLFGIVAATVMFTQTGLSAHFLELLRSIGVTPALAAVLSMCFGVGQFCGRMCTVWAGQRFDALQVNMMPCVLLSAGFLVGLYGGASVAAMVVFGFLYGTGNGVATITRGSLPLLLFDPAHYGHMVGKILAPAFVLAAGAPIAYAWSLQFLGGHGTLMLALGTSLVLLVASIALLRVTRGGEAAGHP